MAEGRIVMTASKIEWTEHTWNPVVGCSIVSPGCTHCYAMQMAARLERMGTAPHYDGLTRKVNGKAVWTGKLALAPAETLLAPLLRKKPTTWFVNSMGDLFHEDIPDDTIDQVFAVMAIAPWHTMQVLTKRASRMYLYMTTPHRKRIIAEQVMTISDLLARRAGSWKARPSLDHFSSCFAGDGPFRNIWLGVSAERQAEADERIPLLLRTPAAIRFVSCEPLLGPIDLMEVIPNPISWGPVHGISRNLNWVIAGGESGPRARPMHPDWARGLRDQCAATGTPFFFKQWGEYAPCYNGDMPRYGFDFGNGVQVYRIGKANSGALLDGREHKAFPEPRA